MGVTPFPHGIIATPNIGASRLSDIWNSQNLFFVDGDNGGGAGADGLSPDNAFALPSAAVAEANKVATIYVRPRTTTTSAQTYYYDNIVIPRTKPGLSIIGCGNTESLPNSIGGVQLRPALGAGLLLDLIDVQGGSLYLANMRLTLNGGTASSLKSIVHANSSATSFPAGLHINGCLFEGAQSHFLAQATDVTGGSIALGTCNYAVIENCKFFNCLGSIGGSCTNGVFGRLVIRDNIFAGAPANRDYDVWLAPGSGDYGSFVVIHNNVFADGVPAHVGSSRWIVITGSGTGIISHNFFASAAADDKWGADGTDAIIPTTFFVVENYSQLGEIVGGT